MRVLLTTGTASVAAVMDALNPHALRRVDETPWTAGVRRLVFAEGPQRVEIAVHAPSGGLVLQVADDDLADQLAASLPAEDHLRVLAASMAEEDAVERIRHVFRLSSLFLVEDLAPESVISAVAVFLSDPEALVRWAAARIFADRSDRATLAALEVAADQHLDLAPVRDRVSRTCLAAEDGTLADTPTEDAEVLMSRGREGIANDQPQRVAMAMDALLATRPEHAEGLLLRALAYERTSAPVLAFALVSAAEAALAGDPPIGTEDRDLPDRIAEARIRIAGSVADLDPTTWNAAAAALHPWLDRWRDRCAGAGAARATMDRIGDLQGRLTAIAARWGNHPELLARAVEAVPDAPGLRVALAAVVRPEDPASARSHLLAALESVAIPIGDRSDDARWIATHTRRSTGRVHVMEALAILDFEGGAYDDAIIWADGWVELDPTHPAAWRIRADACRLTGKDDAAVVAYREGLAVLDQAHDEGRSVGTDEDPRAEMHFHLACVLGRSGDTDGALDALRHAVRRDPERGETARTTPDLAALRSHPDFVAITEGDAAALVLDAERRPGFVDALLKHCVVLSHRGQTAAAVAHCQQAVALASHLDRPRDEARALGIWARVLATDGEIGEADVLSRRAMGRLAHLPDADQAEVLHTRAIVLQRLGDYDGAQSMFERTRDLRIVEHGQEHPSVAKSLGDLARLASTRGDPADGVEALLTEGLDVLEAYLGRLDVPHDATWDEAEIDTCILTVNLGHVLARSRRIDEAIVAMDHAMTRIRRVLDRGLVFTPTFLDNATALAAALDRRARGTPLANTARRAHRGLQIAGTEGPPARASERLFWGHLRALAHQARALGVSDADLADLLQRGVDGQIHEAIFRQIPNLAGLPAEVAERVSRHAGLQTMLAISLDTVRAGGTGLDEALADLESLCLASIAEGEGSR